MQSCRYFSAKIQSQVARLALFRKFCSKGVWLVEETFRIICLFKKTLPRKLHLVATYLFYLQHRMS